VRFCSAARNGEWVLKRQVKLFVKNLHAVVVLGKCPVQAFGYCVINRKHGALAC